MKVFIANSSKQQVGGGWTWIRNFKKSMGDLITENYDEADVYLIASPSMVQRDEVELARQHGKRIVLRVDNAVRNSRNRNTGMTRMKDFAEWADLVVFQSNWAKEYLMPFLQIDENKTRVILNSVDEDIFHPTPTQRIDYATNYLYSRFNRDETKNWEVARYWFSVTSPRQLASKLFIVGNFSPELVEGNFDFYNNENYSYLGVLDEIGISSVYKSCRNFIYTYFNDACSNSLIEALMCGCKIVGDKYYRTTGGAPEILDAFKKYGHSYFSLKRMADEYKEALSGLIL